ncbi:TerB family tellurite resistance protein [Antarcticibacterium flavum]|uniref:TerB family tellurite resistance protein n=1 Tax=Antarcticibacterium flavum TaxID=2058175 RepID=A0A5B7X241_9FLAO|nr:MULTISPECIES: TerB family tellurite resistance protein [Antarcticibacterium]MCM4161151.1 hypothetical protein [Antarcticibacterium sp. W02-3]QCY69350.1 TerB family tellurite resistance protein [Antarcticibacterium flavum]
MAISDLYGSGEHLRNLGHFAAIVSLATVNGELNKHEQAMLERFARKLDISEEEYTRILEKPTDYPIHPNNTYEGRLERLHDLFTIIYSDANVDEFEMKLLKKYAIAIGFSSTVADRLIKRSVQIFSGKLSYDDYQLLIDRK